jgi:hypothetical protein
MTKSVKESKASALRELKARLMLLSGHIYTSGETYRWLLETIGRHPDAAEKLADVVGVEVRRTTRQGLTFPELTLRLSDDGTRDCSWKACVLGKEAEETILRKAMRHAVADQIAYTRERATANQCCWICNDLLRDGPRHVDHVVSFETLATRFMGVSCPLTAVALPNGGYTLADDEPTNHWREFHHTHAQLAVVHAACNLKRGRGRP